jgi:hypothetical protein
VEVSARNPNSSIPVKRYLTEQSTSPYDLIDVPTPVYSGGKDSEETPNSMLSSRSSILASNYTRIWLAIQEIYCKDPHSAVKSVASSLTKRISREIDNELSVQSASLSVDRLSLSNTPLSIKPELDSAQKRFLFHKSSSDSMLTQRYPAQSNPLIPPNGLNAPNLISPGNNLFSNNQDIRAPIPSRNNIYDSADKSNKEAPSPGLDDSCLTSYFYEWMR